MNRERVACMALLYCLGSSYAVASPTSADYRECHRVAAATLQACLDKTPGYRDASRDCGSQATRANDACYDRIRQEGRPDRRRIDAERKATEAARKAMEDRRNQQMKPSEANQ